MKKGRAVVTVMLEVKLSDTWGSECRIDQIFKQAVDGAKQRIDKMLGSDPDIRIKGKPKVEAILVEEDED
jgi:hypothetical protein